MNKIVQMAKRAKAGVVKAELTANDHTALEALGQKRLPLASQNAKGSQND
jgi:hypothetical protein